MLYLETSPGVFVRWTGQIAGDGNIHPRDFASTATAVELEAAGLFSPTDPGIPAGKREVSSAVERVDGIVTVVRVLEDIPQPTPSDVNLTDRQLRIGLLSAGYDLAVVDTAIGAIGDPVDRAIAQVWWDRTTVIQWDHPMTQTLMGLAGIPEQERALLWMWASDIPA